MMPIDKELLTREQFKLKVFSRDNITCVMCDKPAIDAHHIIDRKLFKDGGYYLDNGASLCEEHHLLAESDDIKPETLRNKIWARSIILPDDFDPNEQYDKWGNIVLNDGVKVPGKLYNDKGCQTALSKNLLGGTFMKLFKYPKTMHLPWSPGLQNDDRLLPSTKVFDGKEVVISIKKDGENTSIYTDHIHARSLDSQNHPSRNWVRAFAAKFQKDIPVDWRICGENMYAMHSIFYKNLPSYFLGFSIWNDHNVCLNWDETLEWFKMLGITPVEQLYRGIWDEKLVESLIMANGSFMGEGEEGYVVRTVEEFKYEDFQKHLAKYVRKNHVQTDEHWMNKEIVKNGLAEG